MSQHTWVLLAHGDTAASSLARVAALSILGGIALAGVAVLLDGTGWRTRRRRALLWACGVAALAVAVASPLEDLAEELLCAHMVQHMLLLLVAGPLMVSARVGPPTLAALPERVRRQAGTGWGRVARVLHQPWSIVVVGAVHAGVVLAWHVPVLWEAAVRSPAVHWLEHAMFLAAGAAFWATVLAAGRRRDGAVLVAGFVSVGIATVAGFGLGMLMTFATTPWYPSYPGSAGLDPMVDQQLAGVVMWSAGAPLYVGAVAWLLIRALHHHGGTEDVRQSGVDRGRNRPSTAPHP